MVICIECGDENNLDTYKEFSPGIIKLTTCVKCHKIVDKYIEYDSTIVFLDVVLFKVQAYRHILFNTSIKNYWKFFIFITLSESFLKYKRYKESNSYCHDNKSKFTIDMVFYICSFVFILCVYIILSIFGLKTPGKHIRFNDVARTIIISSYGKLFSLISLPWVNAHDVVHSYLVYTLIFSSDTLALHIRYQMQPLLAILAVLLAFVVTHYLENYFNLLINYDLGSYK